MNQQPHSNIGAGAPRRGAVLAVIIPARNAASTIARCLDAVIAQPDDDVEIMVVDEGSSDATCAIAANYPVTVIRLDAPNGGTAGRNRGAASASAPFLFFTDADVEIGPGVLDRVRRALEAGVPALVGSYDDQPAVRTVVSMFKNLAHHHFHQRSGREVTTFWTGCGAVTRELFESAGGFDEQMSSISDVEFGYRLASRGIHVRLDPFLRVKHLKHWTLPLLLSTDVRLRAMPWAQLLLRYRHLPRNLNFSTDQRVAAGLAFATAALLPMTAFSNRARIALVAAIGAAAWINRSLYRLFFDRGGIRLALGGFLLQQLYYLYSLAGLFLGMARYGWRAARSVSPDEAGSPIRSGAMNGTLTHAEANEAVESSGPGSIS